MPIYSIPGIENFYPRPPRGGRLSGLLSNIANADFYPRPPRGGRLSHQFLCDFYYTISIHALRGEGDVHVLRPKTSSTGHFYPRPPRGGRLENMPKDIITMHISIHALRGEGDL